jgi:hypothetical protein
MTPSLSGLLARSGTPDLPGAPVSLVASRVNAVVDSSSPWQVLWRGLREPGSLGAEGEGRVGEPSGVASVPVPGAPLILLPLTVLFRQQVNVVLPDWQSLTGSGS